MADSMFLDQFGLQEVMKNIGYQLKMLYNRADEIDNIVSNSFYWDGEYISSNSDVLNIGSIGFNDTEYDVYIPDIVWDGKYEKNNTGIEVIELGELSFGSTDYTIYAPGFVWDGEYTSGIKLGTIYFGEEENTIYLPVSYELSKYVNIDEVEEYDSSVFAGSSALLGTLTIGDTDIEIYGPRVSYELSEYVNIDDDDGSVWAGSSALLGTLTIGNSEIKIYGPRIRYFSVYGPDDNSSDSSSDSSDLDVSSRYMIIGRLYIGSPEFFREYIYIPEPVWSGEYTESTGIKLGTFTFGKIQYTVYIPESVSGSGSSTTGEEITSSDVESMITETGVSFN